MENFGNALQKCDIRKYLLFSHDMQIFARETLTGGGGGGGIHFIVLREI